VTEIHAAAPDLDVLVVDDDSPDGTGRIADRLAAADPRVHVIHRAGKLGLGSALAEAFRWALGRGYAVVIEMDCDFSHHPRHLAALRARLADADLVIGSRYVPGGSTPDWGIGRRLLSRSANRFARTLLGLRTADATSGFRCYRATALREIDWSRVRLSGYGFLVATVEHLERLGQRVAEAPIVFEDRRVGQSKMTFATTIEAFAFVLRTAWRSRLRRR
jgi:dolichol-phosphate mannosyltransferase